MTHRLNLESDINTAAAAQILPGRSILTHCALASSLVGVSTAIRGSLLLRGLLEIAAALHRQPRVTGYIIKTNLG